MNTNQPKLSDLAKGYNDHILAHAETAFEAKEKFSSLIFKVINQLKESGIVHPKVLVLGAGNLSEFSPELFQENIISWEITDLEITNALCAIGKMRETISLTQDISFSILDITSGKAEKLFQLFSQNHSKLVQSQELYDSVTDLVDSVPNENHMLESQKKYDLVIASQVVSNLSAYALRQLVTIGNERKNLKNISVDTSHDMARLHFALDDLAWQLNMLGYWNLFQLTDETGLTIVAEGIDKDDTQSMFKEINSVVDCKPIKTISYDWRKDNRMVNVTAMVLKKV
jgi:hypothetical protein